MSNHRRQRHPVQPVEWDGKGVLRFKQNPIVRFLLEQGPFDLNALGRMSGSTGWSMYDWDQFNQLIGYSVSGCPLRSRLNRLDADEKENTYLRKWPNDPEAK